MARHGVISAGIKVPESLVGPSWRLRRFQIPTTPATGTQRVMKIFFFSTVFAPNVGGIEKQVEILCTDFVAMGHEVRLATITPKASEDDYCFAVVRKPSLGTLLRLVNW